MARLGRMICSLAVASLVLACAGLDSARACTTFTLKTPKGTLFGRNYDFQIGDGMIVTNKRGVGKQAAIDPSSGAPARWVSKYGSITFNQFGREFPQGGMNEAGLVVELMWLDGTTYPAPDDRPAVGELGWIEYVLDTCATVPEVLAACEHVRIAGFAPIHYLIADPSGATSTVEFLNGKLVAHQGDSLPSAVLANDRYDSSMAYLNKHEGFGGYAKFASGGASLDRFCRAAAKVKAYMPGMAESDVGYAFGILADVAQPQYTRWSIVYDLSARTIHFRTATNSRIRTLEMSAFDFTCATPVRMYDLASEGGGDVSRTFVKYTLEANRSLLRHSFASVDFLKSTPTEAIDAMAAYPDQLPCVP